MHIIDADIPEIKLLEPRIFRDPRGFFSETWNQRALVDAGLDLDFVQDNHAMSTEAGVLRGLHFQISPNAQDKLVRVCRGRILDVAVDIRTGSPTFGKHVAVEISADNWRQILVPKGFAHGYVTLEPNTEVIYKVTGFYSPEDDRGLAWDDPALGIDWRLDGRDPILSDKDRKHPRLADLTTCFTY